LRDRLLDLGAAAHACLIGHLKTSRAVATRYDQLAEWFLGMLYVAGGTGSNLYAV
jgi:hypothetical protein